MKDALFFSVCLSFILMAIFAFAFMRGSMARIERDLLKDGYGRLCPWDPWGMRAVLLAHSLVLPIGKFNSPNNPLIDVVTVNKYATKSDRWLALAHLITMALFLIVGFMTVWLLELY